VFHQLFSPTHQVAILPIIAESGFRFPSLTFHSELLHLADAEMWDAISGL
jgi:hypothetical protein